MRLAITSVVTVLVLIIVILELLRRRQLREKYAILWLSTIVLILPVAIYPRMVDAAARELGIASGASLVLFFAVVFLLVVCIHLSWEVSRLEEETRTLAEQIALVRTEFSLGGPAVGPTPPGDRVPGIPAPDVQPAGDAAVVAAPAQRPAEVAGE